jgi:hypothetical protein
MRSCERFMLSSLKSAKQKACQGFNALVAISVATEGDHLHAFVAGEPKVKVVGLVTDFLRGEIEVPDDFDQMGRSE